MKMNKGETPELSKDEIITQLKNQNNFLMQELGKSRTQDVYQALHFMFKAVENREAFADEEGKKFIKNCTTEIRNILDFNTEKEGK